MQCVNIQPILMQPWIFHWDLQSTTLQTPKKVSEMVPEEGDGNEKREDGQHDDEEWMNENEEMMIFFWMEGVDPHV